MNQIKQMIADLEIKRKALDTAMGELSKLARTSGPVAAMPARRGRPGKRHMSAEGKARIAAAARKRWAAWRKAQGR